MISTDANKATLPRPPTPWIVLSAIGYGTGCLAGGVALLLLWAYSLTSAARYR